jgi:acyl carrier protein
MSDILDRINEVFQEVFDDDEIRITRDTTAQDVEGWDSLMHVTLLVNIERAFGIRFTSSEVASLKNVGELADLIARHQGGKGSVVPAG